MIAGVRTLSLTLVAVLTACGAPALPRGTLREPAPVAVPMPGPSLRVVHETPLLATERSRVRFSLADDGRAALVWTERGSIGIALVDAHDQLIARRFAPRPGDLEHLDVALAASRVFVRIDGELHVFEIVGRELRALRSLELPELPPRVEASSGGEAWSFRWQRAWEVAPSDLVVVGGRLALAMPRAIDGRAHDDICVLGLALDLSESRAECLEVGDRAFVWLAAEGERVVVRFGNGGRKSEARIDLAYGSVETRDLGEAESWAERSFDRARITRAQRAAGALAPRVLIGLTVIGARAFVASYERAADVSRAWLWELDEEARVVRAGPVPIEIADDENARVIALDERPFFVLASDTRTRICSADGQCTVLAPTRLHRFAAAGPHFAGCGSDHCAVWEVGGEPAVHPIPSQPRMLGALRIGRCDDRWLISLAPAEGSASFPIAPIDDPTQSYAEIEHLDDLVIVGDRTLAMAGFAHDLCQPGLPRVGLGSYGAVAFVGSDGIAVYETDPYGLARGEALERPVPELESPQFDARGRVWGFDFDHSAVLVLGSSDGPRTIDTRPLRPPRVFEHHVIGQP